MDPVTEIAFAAVNLKNLECQRKNCFARYRGIELEALLDLPPKELVKLFPAR
jgi:hypothetical protein